MTNSAVEEFRRAAASRYGAPPEPPPFDDEADYEEIYGDDGATDVSNHFSGARVPLDDVDPLAGLNDEQILVAAMVDGPSVVIAGPGSGKTRALNAKVSEIIASGAALPSEVFVATFTNKAARELKSRVRETLGESVDLSEMPMGTFHSLCLSMLRADGYWIGLPRGFDIYGPEDCQSVVETALEDLGIEGDKKVRKYYLGRIGWAKSELLGPDSFAGSDNPMDVDVQRVYERYESILAASNAIDLDDILVKTHRMFRERPEILEKYTQRYRYLLVDEFQDTNVAQYAILRQLARERRNLTVVGDADQSIYAWRNAKVENILRFNRDFPDAVELRLSRNYRSSGNIVRAASAMVGNNANRLENPLSTENPDGWPIVVQRADDPKQEAETIVNLVSRLRAEDSRWRYGHVGVLYRTNAQSHEIENACVSAGIPYVIVGGIRFYERQEIMTVMAYLRLAANPDDLSAALRVINFPPRRIGPRTVERLKSEANSRGMSIFNAIPESERHESPFAAGAKRALVGFRRIVEGITERMDAGASIAELVDLAMQSSGYAEYLRERDDNSSERMENVNALRQGIEETAGLVGREAVERLLEHAALMSQADEVEDEDRLTLITIHQAKGLEYPIVILAGCEEGTLPHSRSLEAEEMAEVEGEVCVEVEEERRLAYVAMTRAQRRLYLTYSEFRFGRRRSVSRFLKELPRELLRWSKATAAKAG